MRKSKDKSPRKPNVGPAYDLMELSFRLSMGLNVVPFTYDLKRRRFSVNPASLKFATWFVLMFLGIVVELAQMSRELIRAAVDENVSRSDWCFLCLLWTNWWFVAFSHHHILVSHQQMVEHLNQTLGSREWFTEERLPHTEDHKLIRIHLWFSNFQALAQGFLVAAEGTKAHYIYSNLPEEYRTTTTAALWTDLSSLATDI